MLFRTRNMHPLVEGKIIWGYALGFYAQGSDPENEQPWIT